MNQPWKSLSLGACAVALTLSANVSAPAADLWVGRFFENTVSRFSLDSGANLGNLAGGVTTPLGMAHQGDRVYATSESPNQIRMYDALSGATLGNFAVGDMAGPTAIAFDKAGRAYVANFNDSSVSRYGADGTYLGRFIASGAGGLRGPDLGMAFGPDGHLYVPSFYNHKVAKFNGETGAYMGDFITPGSGGLTQPRQLIWRGKDFFVSSDSGNKVLRYDSETGAFKDAFVPAGSGGLFGAAGMAFAGDYLYVTSTRNGKILKYNGATGAFVSEFATGLGSPVSLQVVPEPSTMAGTAIGLAWLGRRLRGK